jgi:uncharacterized protein (TIGR00369 family)
MNDQRRKTITWTAPEACRRDAAGLTGREYLEALRDGRISLPPAAALVGYRIVAVADGEVRYELTPCEEHGNIFGTVHGGILATLLDTAMTAAVIAALPRGRSCSTAEIKVNYLRPVTANTGTLTCEARLLHAGRRLATSEGKVRDRDGRLHAAGLCSCALFTSG